jgi:hypothetical protein
MGAAYLYIRIFNRRRTTIIMKKPHLNSILRIFAHNNYLTMLLLDGKGHRNSYVRKRRWGGAWGSVPQGCNGPVFVVVDG